MSQVIFTFNIRRSVYRNFGLSFYEHVNKSFGMQLLPIVTSLDDGIEHRALKLSQQIPELLSKLKLKSAHFASYSSSGIDLRYAISELGLAKYVKSFTTISSPHHGSKLALLSDRKVFKDEMIEPISRLSGVGLKPFHEFVPENMRHFNNVVKNAQNVEYYSLGSQQLPNLCSYTLSETGKYLFLKTQANFQYHNDGVFGHEQVMWGNHLTNLEADHGQVVGIYGKKKCESLKTVREIAEQWNKKHSRKQKEQKAKQ